MVTATRRSNKLSSSSQRDPFYKSIEDIPNNNMSKGITLGRSTGLVLRDLLHTMFLSMRRHVWFSILPSDSWDMDISLGTRQKMEHIMSLLMHCNLLTKKSKQKMGTMLFLQSGMTLFYQSLGTLSYILIVSVQRVNHTDSMFVLVNLILPIHVSKGKQFWKKNIHLNNLLTWIWQTKNYRRWLQIISLWYVDFRFCLFLSFGFFVCFSCGNRTIWWHLAPCWKTLHICWVVPPCAMTQKTMSTGMRRVQKVTQTTSKTAPQLFSSAGRKHICSAQRGNNTDGDNDTDMEKEGTKKLSRNLKSKLTTASPVESCEVSIHMPDPFDEEVDPFVLPPSHLTPPPPPPSTMSYRDSIEEIRKKTKYTTLLKWMIYATIGFIFLRSISYGTWNRHDQ